jgi:flagellar assembly factor FliW
MPFTLHSSLFGEIDYKEDEVYHFEHGIPGFPHLHSFLFIKVEDSPFTVMHAVKEDRYFFLIDPFERYADYEFSIPDIVLRQLNVERREDIFCYAITVLREPLLDSTVNLAAPILINTVVRKGMQLMFDQTIYSIRTPLFQENNQTVVSAVREQR